MYDYVIVLQCCLPLYVFARDSFRFIQLGIRHAETCLISRQGRAKLMLEQNSTAMSWG
jgi:hypothetical protein